MRRKLESDEILIVEDSKGIDDARHILLSAITGSAKTNFMERIMQMKWEQGNKVIFFTLKDEATTLGFPETDKYLNSVIEENSEYESTAYPTEVLVPFARSFFDSSKSKKMSISLPKHLDSFIEDEKQLHKNGAKYYGWSEWKPFKLSFDGLRSEDLIGLSGKETSSGIGRVLLNYVFETGIKNIGDLLGNLISVSKKDNLTGSNLSIGVSGKEDKSDVGERKSFLSLIAMVSSVQKSGFICDKDNPFVLDLDKIMKEKEVITTFNLSNLDSRFQFMVLSTLLRQILVLRKKGNYPKCCIAVPEISFLCGSRSSFNPFAYLTKPTVEFMSKQGRLLGITLVGDVQSPSDVEGSVLNNFGWFCLGTCSEKTVNFINENVMKLEPPVRYNLSTLPVGTFAIVPMGKSKPYQYPCFVCPSLGFHLKPSVNVFEWIAGWKYVEFIDYVDELSYGVVAEIVPRITKEEQDSKFEKAVGIMESKYQKQFEDEIQKVEQEAQIKVRNDMIIRLYESGKKQREIAEIVGLERSRVSRIIKEMCVRA